METLTLKQAADATGKNKTTILKAIKKGSVIANKNEKGEWKVHIGSLCQNYDVNPKAIEERSAVSATQTTAKSTPGNTKVNTNSTHEIIALRTELNLKDKLLEDREETIKQLRQNEQELKQEKNRFLNMLEKKDNLLTFYQEHEHQAPIPVKQRFQWIPATALSLATIITICAALYFLPEIRDKLHSYQTAKEVEISPHTARVTPLEGYITPHSSSQPHRSLIGIYCLPVIKNDA